MRNIVLHSHLDSLEEEGLLDSGIQRSLSEDELACYAQAAPELAPVFDAIIGNHDPELAAEQKGIEAMRVAG
ncbi:MAG: hypothetical protein ACPHER_06215 [Nevskiales bacterium]